MPLYFSIEDWESFSQKLTDTRTGWAVYVCFCLLEEIMQSKEVMLNEPSRYYFKKSFLHRKMCIHFSYTYTHMCACTHALAYYVILQT